MHRFFYTILNEVESDFADSTGWAQRYGKLYGMRHRNICAEKLSDELELHLKITEKLQPVMTNEGLSYWELYSCKETGLKFKLLPSIILIYNTHIKEREMIAACCKPSGDRELRTAGTVRSQ